MVILKELLSGAGGAGASAGAGSISSTSGGGSSSGAVEQPASARKAIRAPVRRELITEPDTEYIDLGRAQATSQHVESMEVVSRAYTHAMVCLVVNRHTLNL